MRNCLYLNNGGYGVMVDGIDDFVIERCDTWGNGLGDDNIDEPSGDGEGHIRNCLAVEPTGIGLGEGQAVVFIPADSNMKGAGTDGADIGANVLYRYVNGVLTDEPLWDPETGEFPHGALVEGVNDRPGRSAFDVHKRLNIGGGGQPLPYNNNQAEE
jgi:hypothetical protein